MIRWWRFFRYDWRRASRAVEELQDRAMATHRRYLIAGNPAERDQLRTEVRRTMAEVHLLLDEMVRRYAA